MPSNDADFVVDNFLDPFRFGILPFYNLKSRYIGSRSGVSHRANSYFSGTRFFSGKEGFQLPNSDFWILDFWKPDFESQNVET